MFLSTPSRGDKNAMGRFEMGREGTGGTNCCSSSLWHQSEKRRTPAAETTHTVTSTKESMSMRSFTSQWLDSVNSLLELKGRE